MEIFRNIVNLNLSRTNITDNFLDSISEGYQKEGSVYPIFSKLKVLDISECFLVQNP